MPTPDTLDFSCAQPCDTDRLVTLINSAYRGESSRLGWTTEADLLDGLRIDHSELQRILSNPDARILMAQSNDQILGSILIEHLHPQAQLGMLAVHPQYQTLGIGSRLLQMAESLAVEVWKVPQTLLWVIPSRHELIAYYQRRGYRPNAISRPFPENSQLWTPKVSGLTLQQWVKDVY